MTFLAFVRHIRRWWLQWDGRTAKPTREELDRIWTYWDECGPRLRPCHEAIAMQIRMVYPDQATMRELARSWS